MVAPYSGDILAIVARSASDNSLMPCPAQESKGQHLLLDRLAKQTIMTTKIAKIELEHN